MPIAKKDLTKNQKQMIADGFPQKLLLTTAERKAHWDANPPRAVSFEPERREESEETRRFREALEVAAEQKRRARFDKLKKSDKPKRPSREGLISVGEIATRLKMTPQEARAFLRAAKYPKPAQGWAFDARTANEVEKIIKEQQCAPKSKKPSAKHSATSTKKSIDAPAITSKQRETQSSKRSASKEKGASSPSKSSKEKRGTRKETSGRKTSSAPKRSLPKKR